MDIKTCIQGIMTVDIIIILRHEWHTKWQDYITNLTRNEMRTTNVTRQKHEIAKNTVIL